MTHRLTLSHGVLLLGACVSGQETEPLLMQGELQQFASRAQPVLAARCANPSCHGNPVRPLSIYAIHRYRLDPSDVYLDAPLSSDELWHNLAQAAEFVTGDGPLPPLLSKPLDEHAGVRVFDSAEDYDCRQLRAWVEGERQ